MIFKSSQHLDYIRMSASIKYRNLSLELFFQFHVDNSLFVKHFESILLSFWDQSSFKNFSEWTLTDGIVKLKGEQIQGFVGLEISIEFFEVE